MAKTSADTSRPFSRSGAEALRVHEIDWVAPGAIRESFLASRSGDIERIVDDVRAVERSGYRLADFRTVFADSLVKQRTRGVERLIQVLLESPVLLDETWGDARLGLKELKQLLALFLEVPDFWAEGGRLGSRSSAVGRLLRDGPSAWIEQARVGSHDGTMAWNDLLFALVHLRHPSPLNDGWHALAEARAEREWEFEQNGATLIRALREKVDLPPSLRSHVAATRAGQQGLDWGTYRELLLLVGDLPSREEIIRTLESAHSGLADYVRLASPEQLRKTPEDLPSFRAALVAWAAEDLPTRGRASVNQLLAFLSPDEPRESTRIPRDDIEQLYDLLTLLPVEHFVPEWKTLAERVIARKEVGLAAAITTDLVDRTAPVAALHPIGTFWEREIGHPPDLETEFAVRELKLRLTEGSREVPPVTSGRARPVTWKELLSELRSRSETDPTLTATELERQLCLVLNEGREAGTAVADFVRSLAGKVVFRPDFYLLLFRREAHLRPLSWATLSDRCREHGLSKPMENQVAREFYLRDVVHFKPGLNLNQMGYVARLLSEPDGREAQKLWEEFRPDEKSQSGVGAGGRVKPGYAWQRAAVLWSLARRADDRAGLESLLSNGALDLLGEQFGQPMLRNALVWYDRNVVALAAAGEGGIIPPDQADFLSGPGRLDIPSFRVPPALRQAEIVIAGETGAGSVLAMSLIHWGFSHERITLLTRPDSEPNSSRAAVPTHGPKFFGVSFADDQFARSLYASAGRAPMSRSGEIVRVAPESSGRYTVAIREAGAERQLSADAVFFCTRLGQDASAEQKGGVRFIPELGVTTGMGNDPSALRYNQTTMEVTGPPGDHGRIFAVGNAATTAADPDLGSPEKLPVQVGRAMTALIIKLSGQKLTAGVPEGELVFRSLRPPLTLAPLPKAQRLPGTRRRKAR